MEEINNPLVSVIIPTYKRSDSLCRTIDSVLDQTYPNIEIIVVDDNGDGNEYQLQTEELLESYITSEKIKYIKHEVNKNGSAARNTGFRASKGEYINFLDDDDVLMPEKIKCQVESLQTYNKDCSAVYCKCRVIKHSAIKGVYESFSEYNKKGNLVKDYLLEGVTMNTSALLFKRSVISELNGFDDSFIRLQDFELMTRFFKDNIVGCAGNSCLMTYDLTVDRVNFPNLNKLINVRTKFLNQFAKELKGWDLYDILCHKWWMNNADIALRIKDYNSFKECYSQSVSFGKTNISDIFHLLKALIKGLIS